MKITYLHQYFNTPDMQGGTRSYEMARRLVSRGHEVHLITTSRDGIKRPKKSIVKGINIYWIEVPYTNKMNFINRVWAFAKFSILSSFLSLSIKSDIVFATSTPLTIAIPGIVTKWFRRIPLVFEIRDVWPEIPIQMGIIKNPVLIWLSRSLEKLAYNESSHIVALSPGMGEEAISTGIKSSKVSIIQNGCDINSFNKIKDIEKLECKNKNSWINKRKLVLYAGTFGRANGVEYAVNLAQKVNEIDSNIVFACVGWGSEKERVIKLAKENRVLENNFYVLDPLSKKDLFILMSISDFTLALFDGPRILWKDAVQNKFFDSLAAGKPIACNFEGYQSLLAIENEVGIILKKDNLVNAANDLVSKINDQIWINNAEKNALNLAKGYFSRDNLAIKLENILLSVLEKKNG